MTIKLELDNKEVEVVLAALSELPFRQVNALIVKVVNQLQEQLAEKPQA